MAVDLSAIAAILFAEAEARAFLAEIAGAGIRRLPAVNFVEVGIVVRRDASGARKHAFPFTDRIFRVGA